jgi:methionyl-tRNA synthetase
MKKRVLVTSALPYINGVKHLGNLVGSMLPADVYARYLRSRGRDVLFICATDEHGTPAELAAKDAGLEVAEFCRQQHKLQAELARRFRLSFDHFGRSSSAQNRELTQYFFSKLEEHGLIEERSTSQIYSIDDARFLPDRYVIGTCPHCGYTAARGDQCESCTRLLNPTDLIAPRSAVSGSTRLEVRESRHLFLLQSKLADQLRAWIESRVGWPPLVTSIAVKWLNEGLEDRGITRDLKWGVPVNKPGFEDKVFYVWFDAPIEYIAATKEWADLQVGREWRSWWSATGDVHYVQFMAKDNVPFHTIMFPATIIGAADNWKLPDYIKAFNWLTYYGGKFSTSQHRGVFMSDAIDLLPADYWRYWLLANAPEANDADFTWDLFATMVEADLAATFGNFVNRITKFCASRFGDFLPEEDGEDSDLEERLYTELGEKIAAYEGHLESHSFRKALRELKEIWRAGNVYLTEAAPWKAKPEENRGRVAVRIGINLVRLYAVLASPVMPDTSELILDALDCSAEERLWPEGPIKNELSRLRSPRRTPHLDLLFRPIDPALIELWKVRFGGSEHGLADAPSVSAL